MSEEYSKSSSEMSPRCPANLKRRSSIQKILHMCNQSYQVFPHVFLWFQGFQSTLHADLRKVIPLARSLPALRLGVYLSIALLLAELFYCLTLAFSFLLASGSAFLVFCIGILSLLALQIFDVAVGLRKKLRGGFFVKKKQP